MRSLGSFFNARYAKMCCLLIRNRFYDIASHRETPFGTRIDSCKVECSCRTVSTILHTVNNTYTQEIKIKFLKKFYSNNLFIFLKNYIILIFIL